MLRPPRNLGLTRHVLALVLAVCAVASGPIGAIAQEATPHVGNAKSTAQTHLAAASAWLRTQQDASGGFVGYSGKPDPGTTTDAVMALYAAREADPDAAGALDAAVGYLEANGADYAATGPGQAAKLTLAAIAGGHDPRHFAGMNLIAAMTAAPATPVPEGVAGIYGDDLYDHALVLIALTAAGETVADSAIEPIRASQGTDGGWAYDGSTAAGAADSNTTALIIEALAATGHGDDQMIAQGLAFLKSLLAPDGGGFAFQAADPLLADANSTAFVLQALMAAGEDPTSSDWGNVPQALAQFQTPQGGLRYMASDNAPNLLATVQAIPALAGLPLPVAMACTAAEPAESDGCVPLAPAA
jgi:hypothetical protein